MPHSALSKLRAAMEIESLRKQQYVQGCFCVYLRITVTVRARCIIRYHQAGEPVLEIAPSNNQQQSGTLATQRLAAVAASEPLAANAAQNSLPDLP
jgi:hypothetical protein